MVWVVTTVDNQRGVNTVMARGVGRPKKHPSEHRRHRSIRLSPNVDGWLLKQNKIHGISITYLIETALIDQYDITTKECKNDPEI